MKFSVVVPVYNRPDEMELLLGCLARQTYSPFEVVIVESGSEIKSDKVCEAYQGRLDIHYYYKSNEGQGFSRNYGFARATGDYFVILDSDVLLDDDFLETLAKHIHDKQLDAHGGPDRLQPDSTPVQKAVNHIMTSTLTTGGMRGGKKAITKFYPRSFNMGFSRKVYDATGGYKLPYFGEDIELSVRIMDLGFRVGLVPECHVYHKRKESLSAFARQMKYFGRARVNTYLLFKDSLKLAHLFPLAMLTGTLVAAMLTVFLPLAGVLLGIPMLYTLVVGIDGTLRYGIKSGLISMAALWVFLWSYGSGFAKEWVDRVWMKRPARP